VSSERRTVGTTGWSHAGNWLDRRVAAEVVSGWKQLVLNLELEKEARKEEEMVMGSVKQ
jgi:hypothetical protein